MKPSVLWHFLAVLDSTRCWYSAVFGIPPLLQSLYLPTLIVPQNCEHPFSSQDRTQLHIAQQFISWTLLLVRIAKWGCRYSLRRKTELSVRTRERKANATGSQRKSCSRYQFFFSFILSAGLIFLCGSSHHVITGRKKDAHMLSFDLFEGGDTNLFGHLLHPPLRQRNLTESPDRNTPGRGASP